MNLLWRKDVRHGGAHMVQVENTYVPHERVPKFLEGEHGHGELVVEWNIYKHVPPQKRCQDTKDPKPSWPYMVFFFHFHLLPLLFNS